MSVKFGWTQEVKITILDAERKAFDASDTCYIYVVAYAKYRRDSAPYIWVICVC